MEIGMEFHVTGEL